MSLINQMLDESGARGAKETETLVSELGVSIQRVELNGGQGKNLSASSQERLSTSFVRAVYFFSIILSLAVGTQLSRYFDLPYLGVVNFDRANLAQEEVDIHKHAGNKYIDRSFVIGSGNDNVENIGIVVSESRPALSLLQESRQTDKEKLTPGAESHSSIGISGDVNVSSNKKKLVDKVVKEPHAPSADTVSPIGKSSANSIDISTGNHAVVRDKRMDSGVAKEKISIAQNANLKQKLIQKNTSERNLNQKNVVSLKDPVYQVESDKNTANRAKALLYDGQKHEAAELLLHYLKAHQYAPVSRIVLFDYYVDNHNILEANRLLALAEKDRASFLVYMNARLATLAGKKERAIKMLESTSPDSELFDNYYGLLAALYQEAKQYRSSVKLYRKLIQRDSQNPSFWLGLAVSSDFLGNTQDALRSYQMVNKIGRHEFSVMSFVQQRINALGENGLTGVAPW